MQYEEPPVEEVVKLRSVYEEPSPESPYAKLPIRTAPLRPSSNNSLVYDLPPPKQMDQVSFEPFREQKFRRSNIMLLISTTRQMPMTRIKSSSKKGSR